MRNTSPTPSAYAVHVSAAAWMQVSAGVVPREVVERACVELERRAALLQLGTECDGFHIVGDHVVLYVASARTHQVTLLEVARRLRPGS